MRSLLLLTAILLTLQASAGVIVYETKAISHKAVPKELAELGGQLYILKYSYSNPEQHKLIEANSVGDSIINLKPLLTAGMVRGYRVFMLDFVSMQCPITKMLELDKNRSVEYSVSFTAESAKNGQDIIDVPAAAPGGPLKVSVPSRLCQTSDFGWMNKYEVYDVKELENYEMPRLWVLSVGIDEYGSMKFQNCKTDAESYASFFSHSFNKDIPFRLDQGVNLFTLTNKIATRDSILGALKQIAKNSRPDDYFVFNFAGFSIQPDTTYQTAETHFAAYGWKDYPNGAITDFSNLISLSELKEYLEYMPARNQLFITESGLTDRFRQEFISTLLSKNPLLENLLNKNRVIIVPNGMGMDNLNCQGSTRKGPLNYYITSLDSSQNIFELFSRDKFEVSRITHDLYNKHNICPVNKKKDYFSIFFEKEFMELVGSLSGSGMQMRSNRDGYTGSTTPKIGYGKKYALVIGTDTYQSSKEWARLPNAVYDAREIAAELEKNYGYTVDTIYNPTMNQIYEKLWSYSAMLGSTDQFLLYVSGHGDYDSLFLDDGVIVCSDSKLTKDDRSRNSYIPYAKLERILNRMPTGHLLVMLDVCFGGTFDKRVATKRNKDEAPVYAGLSSAEIIAEKAALRTRRFISSGSKVPVPDGYPGLHSPFAYFVLEILRGKGGTNGYFTATQIYARLQERLKSNPLSDGFGSNEAGSDYVFEYAPKK